MKKYLLILTCFILASCGKPLEKKNDVLFNNPDADFDLDGQSNIEEINLGQNPYVNSTLFNPILKSKAVNLSLYLNREGTPKETLNFLSVKRSQKYFDDSLLQNSITHSDDLSDIKKISHELYFKNAYKCISKDEIRKLTVKYNNFSIIKSIMLTSFSDSISIENIYFYLYDFRSINPLYFQKDSSEYDFKSYNLTITDDAIKNGFCILYDTKKQRKASKKLEAIFIYRNNILEKNAVDTKRLNGLMLNQTFEIGSFIYVRGIYLPASYSKVRFFKYESVKNLDNSLFNADVRVGDRVRITRYIQSRIKYRSKLVGKSNSVKYGFRSSTLKEIKIPGGCHHYQRPITKDSFIFKSLGQFLHSDFKLKIGKVFVLPYTQSDFYVSYDFEVTEDMFIDYKLNINLSEVSTTEVSFNSLYFTQKTSGSHSCVKPFRRNSTSTDVVEYQSELYVERLESL